jgi:small subunit ribosomal protein S1
MDTHDTANEEFNFEEMLEASLNRRDDFEPGESVTGVVVQINDESVFLDIAGKSEATLDRIEFTNDDGTLSVQKGDTVQAFVVSQKGGEVHLTRSIGKGRATQELLAMAYRKGVPVHGVVTEVKKGGYTVSVSGTRAFCPFSQIDLKSPDDPQGLLSKSFTFLITEYGEGGRNIIVSRRVLLESEKERLEEDLKKNLKPGDTVSGPISSIRDFGLFVDIGGIEALVPKSEISRSRSVGTAGFSPGDRVTALVKSLDWENRRISLSIKDLSPDPWATADRFSPGDRVEGRVVNFIKSGAFIEIEPGVEGFLHISRMNLVKKISRPEEMFVLGDKVSVKIQSINENEKKLSLDLVDDGQGAWNSREGGPEEIVTGTVERVIPQGVNLRLASGILAFIPKRELAGAAGQDMQKKNPLGSEIKAAVIEFDSEKKNMILSEKKALETSERSEYAQFQEQHAPREKSNLGNLLKGKFEEIQKNMKKD